MTDIARISVLVVFMGAAGAALMDVWAWMLRRVWNVSTLDYALLGRWIGHMPRRVFVHKRIGEADPIRWERPLGLLAHYAIGIAFALPVVVIGGPGWTMHPSIVPAMAVALATLVAPWLVMQPAMGMGFAASRSPNPRATRLRNIGTHVAYGVGLYASAMLLSAFW